MQQLINDILHDMSEVLSAKELYTLQIVLQKKLNTQNNQTYPYTVNVNIRMYNFDDVQCTVIPSVAYGFVTGMNLQLC